MALERTLTIVKPENELICGQIFAFLDATLANGFTAFPRVRIDKPNRGLVMAHYTHISHVPTYEDTLKAFTNGTVFGRIYFGENIAQRVRDVLGPTKCEDAKAETLRGHFWDESYISWKNAQEKGLYYNNFMHASKNSEEAEKEIVLWRRFHPNLIPH